LTTAAPNGTRAHYTKKVTQFSRLTSIGKIGEVTPEATTRIREEYVGDPTKLVRDRFYDFFQRVTRQGEPRIDTEELNKSLTIKVDELPDSTKIQDIFERLNSKVALNSKGKKNWSEEETTFFIWVILTYCDQNKYDYQDLVSWFFPSDHLNRMITTGNT
jgi:hypothetical protein